MYPKSICVYCGSSNQVEQHFKDLARDVGKMLADHHIRLVYGGGKVGLMGIVADTVMQNGGEAIGIIPEHIVKKEIQNEDLTELHVVDSMHTRKQMMVDRSDAFLVLPGGIGTLEEMAEVMTWRQLTIHDKPIVIMNHKEYWTPYLTMLDNLIAHNFMRKGDRKLAAVVEKVDQILPALKKSREEQFEASSKWI